ncbi:MAG: hypothetical protein NWE89_06955 [Candidatus Bathyarchaeota archaeon]|nr:hypothetical protein [Candidatus Bathyarchaeota archaeon]
MEECRSYPRVKYYETKIKKKEVTAMIKIEFPKYKELLIMEVLVHPHEARNPAYDE